MTDDSSVALVIPNLPPDTYVLFEQRCTEAGLDAVLVLTRFMDECGILESTEVDYQRVVFNRMILKTHG